MQLLLLYRRLKEDFSHCKDVAKDRSTRDHPSSMDCREQGSQARGVYPTQDTSRMETVKVKQKEKENAIIIIAKEEK